MAFEPTCTVRGSAASANKQKETFSSVGLGKKQSKATEARHAPASTRAGKEGWEGARHDSPLDGSEAWSEHVQRWDVLALRHGALAPPVCGDSSRTGCNERGGKVFATSSGGGGGRCPSSYPRLWTRQRKATTDAERPTECATDGTGGSGRYFDEVHCYQNSAPVGISAANAGSLPCQLRPLVWSNVLRSDADVSEADSRRGKLQFCLDPPPCVVGHC